jgi:hypothetical protein
MATSGLPLIGIAALLLTACDLSQKRPETMKPALPRDAGVTQTAPASIGPTPHSPAAGKNPDAQNGAVERSIRLYGPGVSRKRQVRV